MISTRTVVEEDNSDDDQTVVEEDDNDVHQGVVEEEVDDDHDEGGVKEDAKFQEKGSKEGF